MLDEYLLKGKQSSEINVKYMHNMEVVNWSIYSDAGTIQPTIFIFLWFIDFCFCQIHKTCQTELIQSSLSDIIIYVLRKRKTVTDNKLHRKMSQYLPQGKDFKHL